VTSISPDRIGAECSSRSADVAYFARVEVDLEAGTITWPDGLDMAPEPLYDEARRHPVETTRSAV
jgi:hypothetical protein